MLGLVNMTRALCLESSIVRVATVNLLRPTSGLPEANTFYPSCVQIRSRHNTIRDLRLDFNYKRERPIGPHKHKTPNLVGARNSLNYRHLIKYPKKYTIRKLDMTKLGGRHPVTGRKVIAGVGGGSKQKVRWIDWNRLPADWPRDGSILEERVMLIKYDPLRKAKICMTGYSDKLRWQVATDKIEEGDIIRTHTDIPKMPIRPVEGDSHPLGALPMGTTICLVEAWPGEGSFFAKKAEENATIIRKVGDRVVIKCWDKLEFAIPEAAQCTVGTVSIHPLKKMHIGSPNRYRWLGNAPRSGLWKKKDGRRGRKIKKPPPTIYTTPYAKYMEGHGTPSNPGFKGRTVLLDNLSEGKRGRIKPMKRCMPDAPRNTIYWKREYRPGFGKNPGVAGYKYGVYAPGFYS